MQFLTIICVNTGLEKIRHKIILSALFLIGFYSAQAQLLNYTPYSRYGIGEMNEGLFGAQFAAGHQTIAYRSMYNINLGNPASYGSLGITAFDIGLVNNNTSFISSNNPKVKGRVSSFSYMALGFPVIRNRWGACFGIKPFSGVGYRINDEENITNIGTVKYTYEGEGGTNEIFLGNGFNLISDSIHCLSLGINASYVFGTINNTRKVLFNDTLKAFNIRAQDTKQLEGFNFNAGLMYHYMPKKNNNTYTIGAVGALENSLFIKEGLIVQRYTQREIDGQIYETYKDTLLLKNERGTVSLPQMLGFGFSWGKRKKAGQNEYIKIGVDYKFQNWSTYKSFGQSDNLANSSKIALGLHYIPISIETAPVWIRRSQFRLGGYYSNTYLNLKGRQLTDIGATIGWGYSLPGNKYTPYIGSINVGLNVGQRGTVSDNLIKEQYFNVMLNFTLNDRWFVKRKVD